MQRLDRKMRERIVLELLQKTRGYFSIKQEKLEST